MTRFLGLTLGAILFLTGCGNMKPSDFKNAEPKLIIEEYFSGQTMATGIFEDRFGDLRRQFTVEIEGSWDGTELILDEKFVYADGEKDQRIWTITKTNDHVYEGRADDIIGIAQGEAYGNALHWRYDMNLKIGDSTVRVHFNDWMYLQPNGVLLNRARVSKLGIEIGTVTLAFTKEKNPALAFGAMVNERQGAPLSSGL